MTREIKFRAWDKRKKEMFDLELGMVLPVDFKKDFKILQFTGLKDKNGKEIYEGDIIFDDVTKNNMILGWFRDRFGLFPVKQTEFNKGFPIDLGLYHFLEHNKTGVIGNKFENPELLK